MPITLDGTNGITTPMYNGSIAANAVTPSVNMKNRIINGAMVIDQRNAGASVTPTNGQYSVDRWACFLSQASKYSVQQNAGSVTPPDGFRNYLGVTSLASTSLGAGDYFMLNQALEGFNIADLMWGTASAKTITISFWVRSSLTGTFGACLGTYSSGRSYPFTYTISSANTWEQKSVTIAGDTSGTWNTNNSGAMALYFGLGVGTTYSGTAGSWSGGNFYSATGATSVVGTNGATFYITGVQLEVGSTATSFDYRPYGTELQLCQRYFAKLGGTTSTEGIGFGSNQDVNTSGWYLITYPTTMRAAPTLAYSSINVTDNANGSLGISSIRGQVAGVNSANFGLNYSSTGGWSTTYRPMMIITATTAGFISMSAEL